MKKCEIEGCDRKAVTNNKNCGCVCSMHWKRFKRHGSFESRVTVTVHGYQGMKCSCCDTIIGTKGKRGMCNKHYLMWRTYGDSMHFDNRERPKNHGYYRKNQIGEHRKVYEDFYGVKLKSTQIVHHIDFNRTNNAIENLWLFDNRGEHSKVHRDYEKLLKLYPAENIVFENGKYIYKGDFSKSEKA